MPVAYVDYKTLDDEFYTLKRVCHLLEFDKLTLKEKCEAYAIRPQRNEVGEWLRARGMIFSCFSA